MAEYTTVMKHFKRMCKHYRNYDEHLCINCPLESFECGRVPCSWVSMTDEQVEMAVMDWAKEHPEPQYPQWTEWLVEQGIIEKRKVSERKYELKPTWKAYKQIPADIAEKLGVKPK